MERLEGFYHVPKCLQHPQMHYGLMAFSSFEDGVTLRGLTLGLLLVKCFPKQPICPK